MALLIALSSGSSLQGLALLASNEGSPPADGASIASAVDDFAPGDRVFVPATADAPVVLAGVRGIIVAFAANMRLREITWATVACAEAAAVGVEPAAT